jgi:hypothetical protein
MKRDDAIMVVAMVVVENKKQEMMMYQSLACNVGRRRSVWPTM